MINANELRIGNWVKYEYGFTNIDRSKGFNSEFYQITMNTFYTEVSRDEGRTILDQLFPIPLTPDILDKIDWNGYIKYHFNSHFSIDDVGHLDYHNDYTGINIDYLHQLQNLYFALTGKELEVKL